MATAQVFQIYENSSQEEKLPYRSMAMCYACWIIMRKLSETNDRFFTKEVKMTNRIEDKCNAKRLKCLWRMKKRWNYSCENQTRNVF